MTGDLTGAYGGLYNELALANNIKSMYSNT